MRFESQTFWLAKDAKYPDEYQDAFLLDAERGLAIIADGVASAIFSGPWARTLVRGTLDDPPRLHDAEHFQEWLLRQRRTWASQIDATKLPWNLRPKMALGAMSTLLWIELSPLAEESAVSQNGPSRYVLRGYSIGDCCLFHLRRGELLRTFPISSSSEFGLDPKVLGSIDRQMDHQLEFQAVEDVCEAGDLIVLCTDAVGLWAMSQIEQGQAIDWDRYWDLPYETWQEEIFDLRRSKQMRYDDTTLMLLRLVAAPVHASESPPVDMAATIDQPAPECATVADEPAMSMPETPDEPAAAPAPERVAVDSSAAECLPIQDMAGTVSATKPLDEPSDDDLNQAIADLQSDSSGIREAALAALRKAKVTESRKAGVATALGPLLQDADWRLQQSAAAALRSWGTAESVPSLLPLAQHDNVFVRRDVLLTLGALRDPRGVGVLADRLLDSGDRGTASQALRCIGPGCEPELLRVMKVADGFAHWEIFSLLSDLGTEACLPLLRDYAQDDDFGVRIRAEAALKAIAARHNVQPT